jgi:hypothetical protein
MNIFELLRREDIRLLKILRKLEDTTSPQAAEREMLLHQVRIHVFPLNVVLREHIYPTIVLSLGNQDQSLLEIVERARGEDEELEGLLDQLGEVSPQEKLFGTLLERLLGQGKLLAQWKERELYEPSMRLMEQDQADALGEMAFEELKAMRQAIAGS